MDVSEAKPTLAPLYIAACDTESPRCVAAPPKIVAMHEKYDMPAT